MSSKSSDLRINFSFGEEVHDLTDVEGMFVLANERFRLK